MSPLPLTRSDTVAGRTVSRHVRVIWASATDC